MWLISQRLTFIYFVYLIEQGNSEPIEILMPAIESEELLSAEWLIEKGISKVVLVDKSNKEFTLFDTEIQPEKVLRLIRGLPLPASEFQEVTAASGDVVGCTGDGSLGNCLIADKIPFYGLRKHKVKI